MSGSQTTPLLSLCLATYNRARYLDRYLSHHLTALDAAGIDYELVVSDNASTDETPQILARWAAAHPRMRVSRRPRNLGAYPNILTTLRQARGEVVVSIADDDLAIPEQLVAYARRIADDPALVMIQAPWLLMDETRDGAITGKFYDFPGETRFSAGQFGNCLAFVLTHHVFPECWLARRSALAAIAGPQPRFTYSFFNLLAGALARGDVLFSPEPHLMATSVTRAGASQVGNREAMESWDLYRGGLEAMASYARQFNPGALPDAAGLGAAIVGFVAERMVVAAKLQVHARRWSRAYEILRRLYAYEIRPEVGADADDVARLAAIETALRECAERGAQEIVVGDSIPQHVLDLLTPPEGVALVRPNALGGPGIPRGWCQIGEAAEGPAGPDDIVCDVVPAMDRFPVFSAG
ncbi:MAG: glycosyltransferase family 2 protein [Proteobacteria bacterium]|nr:glycosyltransferase family 2 protein [Pseudomonadota bacterium]